MHLPNSALPLPVSFHTVPHKLRFNIAQSQEVALLEVGYKKQGLFERNPLIKVCNSEEIMKSCIGEGSQEMLNCGINKHQDLS